MNNTTYWLFEAYKVAGKPKYERRALRDSTDKLLEEVVKGPRHNGKLICAKELTMHHVIDAKSAEVTAPTPAKINYQFPELPKGTFYLVEETYVPSKEREVPPMLKRTEFREYSSPETLLETLVKILHEKNAAILQGRVMFHTLQPVSLNIEYKVLVPK